MPIFAVDACLSFDMPWSPLWVRLIIAGVIYEGRVTDVVGDTTIIDCGKGESLQVSTSALSPSRPITSSGNVTLSSFNVDDIDARLAAANEG